MFRAVILAEHVGAEQVWPKSNACWVFLSAGPMAVDVPTNEY